MTTRELRIAEMLLKIRDRRVTFATKFHKNTRGERMDFTRNSYLPPLYNSLARVLVIQGSVQSKKAQPLTSRVHTPVGWRLMGDLKVGDIVSTPDGLSAPIQCVQPQGIIGIYKIVLSDGRVVEACGDHLWKVRWSNCRFKPCRGLVYESPEKSEILTTSEIGRRMAQSGGRFLLPLTKPVEKPEVTVPLDPYFLGAMLGDGEISNTNVRFSSNDEELVGYVNEGVSSFGLTLKQYKSTGNYYFVGGGKGSGRFKLSRMGLLKEAFKSLGLLGTDSYSKFIPDMYKNGSIAQRFAVLQGLLDTDGGGHGNIVFASASKRLANDVCDLVHSLGGIASVTCKESNYVLKDGSRHRGATCFWVSIQHPQTNSLFRLKRKKESFAITNRRSETMGPVIEKIIFVGKKPAQCIILDNKEHLYITDGYVVTHNSEFLIIDHLAAAAEGLSVFFVLPKVESRITYVQNRIDKRIREVPEYRRLMADGSFDNTLMKSFGRGTIKYVGSNVISDFKEFPADCMYVEEVDQCDPENVEYGRDRLRGSVYQFRKYVGNPTTKGVGVNMYFERSTKNVWHVPCPTHGPHCPGMIELDWFNTVIQQKLDDEGMPVDYTLMDESWKPNCGRDLRCVCPHCGDPIDRVGTGGLWVPKNEESDIEGFLMTMLNSWENPLTEMLESWKDAWETGIGMQQFYNSFLGLPFTSESSRLTIAMLRRNAYVMEPYNFVLKKFCAHIESDRYDGKNNVSMGIDVGKKFDVRISEVLPSGSRRALFIGKVDSRSELLNLGVRYKVKCAVIDSGPEFRVVSDFQDEAPFYVWSCRYDSEGADKRTKKDRKIKMVLCDRTLMLDKTLSLIKSCKNVLPRNFEGIMSGEYAQEMTESVRQEESDKSGRVRFVWSKCKDHSRHADVYDMLAADMCKNTSLSGITVG